MALGPRHASGAIRRARTRKNVEFASLHGRAKEITDAASRSAVFLAVTSTAYVARDWTRLELETFVKASSNVRSLFAVEYLPLDEGEHYPAPLDRQSRLRMWEQDSTISMAALPIPASNDVYRSRLHDLADRIKKHLIAINGITLN